MSDGGWTFKTLLVHIMAIVSANDRYYRQRFTDQKIAVDAALAAAKEAVVKAETAADKRFDSVNELRGMAEDQQRINMPRSEAELRFKAIEQKIATLESSSVERRGKQAGAIGLWGWIAGVIGITLALISFFLRL